MSSTITNRTQMNNAVLERTVRRDVEIGGTRMLKIREDLLRWRKILTDPTTKPTVLIETGTWYGNSARWFSRFVQLVITIDVAPKWGSFPDNVRFIEGNSTDFRVLAKVRDYLRPSDLVTVTLDSDHHADHVTRELDCYSEVVTSGQYLVVEDTIHAYRPEFADDNPQIGLRRWADAAFLPSFYPDRDLEGTGPTMNPGGWLRRL